jgi:hypothetical protein
LAVFRVVSPTPSVAKLLELGAKEFVFGQGISERDPNLILLRIGSLTDGPLSTVKNGDKISVSFVRKDFVDKREVNRFF